MEEESKTLEEGDSCPKQNCKGVLSYYVEDCYCHTNPPCSNCENCLLSCNICNWGRDESDWEEVGNKTC